MKTRASKTITATYDGVTIEVAKNVSVRLTGENGVGYEFDGYRPRIFYPCNAEVNPWMNSLSRIQEDELVSLIMEWKTSPSGTPFSIVNDWLEDNGAPENANGRGQTWRDRLTYADRMVPLAKPFDKTFRVGDMAEYNSYNLCFFGPIIAIGEKTVTIQDKYGDQKYRLSLESFCRKNRNFDLAKAQKRNDEWRD